MTMQSVLIGVQRENLFSTITSVQAFGFETASASYQIIGGEEVGTTVEDGVAQPAQASDWLVPTAFSYNYEIRATLLSGSTDGTFGTFLDPGSNPNWSVFASLGSVQGTIRLEFRRKGDTNILLTKDVFLLASTFA
jgi:hypothetical protein